MRTLDTIHAEIEQLSEERAELWHRLSAGHDRHVAPDFFFARRPTYVAATVTEIDADPLTDFTPEVIQIMRRGIVRMERRPLPPDDGFPPGLELRVLRLSGP